MLEEGGASSGALPRRQHLRICVALGSLLLERFSQNTDVALRYLSEARDLCRDVDAHSPAALQTFLFLGNAQLRLIADASAAIASARASAGGDDSDDGAMAVDGDMDATEQKKKQQQMAKHVQELEVEVRQWTKGAQVVFDKGLAMADVIGGKSGELWALVFLYHQGIEALRRGAVAAATSKMQEGVRRAHACGRSSMELFFQVAKLTMYLITGTSACLASARITVPLCESVLQRLEEEAAEKKQQGKKNKDKDGNSMDVDDDDGDDADGVVSWEQQCRQVAELRRIFVLLKVLTFTESCRFKEGISMLLEMQGVFKTNDDNDEDNNQGSIDERHDKPPATATATTANEHGGMVTMTLLSQHLANALAWECAVICHRTIGSLANTRRDAPRSLAQVALHRLKTTTGNGNADGNGNGNGNGKGSSEARMAARMWLDAQESVFYGLLLKFDFSTAASVLRGIQEAWPREWNSTIRAAEPSAAATMVMMQAQLAVALRHGDASALKLAPRLLHQAEELAVGNEATAAMAAMRMLALLDMDTGKWAQVVRDHVPAVEKMLPDLDWDKDGATEQVSKQSSVALLTTYVKALLHIHDEDLYPAKKTLRVLIRVVNVLGLAELTVRVLCSLGHVFLAHGSTDQARDVLRTALSFAQKMEHQPFMLKVLTQMQQVNATPGLEPDAQTAEQTRSMCEQLAAAHKAGLDEGVGHPQLKDILAWSPDD